MTFTAVQRHYAETWADAFAAGLRDAIDRYPEFSTVNFDDPDDNDPFRRLGRMPWVQAAPGVLDPVGQPWMGGGAGGAGLWLAAGLRQWEHQPPESWSVFAWASFVADAPGVQLIADAATPAGHYAVSLGDLNPRQTHTAHQPAAVAAALLAATHAWCVHIFGRPTLP